MIFWKGSWFARKRTIHAISLYLKMPYYILVTAEAWKCFRCNLTFKEEPHAKLHEEISKHSVSSVKIITAWRFFLNQEFIFVFSVSAGGGIRTHEPLKERITPWSRSWVLLGWPGFDTPAFLIPESEYITEVGNLWFSKSIWKKSWLTINKFFKIS